MVPLFTLDSPIINSNRMQITTNVCEGRVAARFDLDDFVFGVGDLIHQPPLKWRDPDH